MAGRDLQLCCGRRVRTVRRVFETPWNIHCEFAAEAALVQRNGGKKRLNGQRGCIGCRLSLSTDKERHCISLSIARDSRRGPRWTEES